MKILEDWQILSDKQKRKIGQRGNNLQRMGNLDVLDDKWKKKPFLEERQNKINEIINISNYITLETQEVQLNILLKMMELFHIHHQFIIQKLSSIAKQLKLNQKHHSIDIYPQKTKIEVCFSSKWRQTQQIIFLFVKHYITSNNKQKIRVILLNKRGIILQTISNLQPSKYKLFIAKTIKKSYSKLSRLIVLPVTPQLIDLDFNTTLQQNLEQVKIISISWKKLQDAYGFKQKSNFDAQFYELRGQNQRRYSIILYQKLLICGQYKHEIQKEDFHGLIIKSIEIIKREDKVNQYFNYIPEFSSIQFFIRLFTFYYNFVAVESLELQHQNRINLAIITKLIIQLQKKIQVQSIIKQEIQASFSDSNFNAQQSSKNHKQTPQHPKNDLKQYNQTKYSEKDAKKSRQNDDAQPTKCSQPLIFQWDSLLEGQKEQFDQFLKRSSKTVFCKNLCQGMNLLRKQHQLMIKPIKQLQSQVKKQQI